MIHFGDEKLGKALFKLRDYTPVPLICMIPFVLKLLLQVLALGRCWLVSEKFLYL